MQRMALLRFRLQLHTRLVAALPDATLMLQGKESLLVY
jgi:hypothetical protein